MAILNIILREKVEETLPFTASNNVVKASDTINKVSQFEYNN